MYFRDQVSDLLQSASNSGKVITSLEIVIKNVQLGPYSKKPYAEIDIRPIAKLINITQFAILPEAAQISQLSYITFNNDTFQNLTKMKVLKINIPIFDKNSDLHNIVRPLIELKFLDLSLTKFLSVPSLTRVLQHINIEVSHMCLISFQVLGSSYYNNTGKFNIIFNIIHLTLQYYIFY